MGRKKSDNIQKPVEPEMTLAVMEQPQFEQAPVPVQVMREKVVNPDIGVIPFEGDPLPSRRYRFQYNQQPGTPIEFTRGVTMLCKGTHRRKNVFFQYKIEDGEEIELPNQIAEFLMGLTYLEDGRTRARCTLIPVS